MPYIEPQRRPDIGPSERPHDQPGHVGELVYVLTLTVDEFLGGSPRFSDLAEVIGALEATKLELYRRVVAPYEDEKCHQNGDVYRRRGYR